MCGNFGTKTKDVETANTVNAAGVRNGTLNLLLSLLTGSQQNHLFLTVHYAPGGGLLGTSRSVKPHPALPMTVYK